MRDFFKNHDVGIKELLILAIILLSGYSLWLHRQLVKVKVSNVSQTVQENIPWKVSTNVVDKCGKSCQEEIEKRVADSLATASAKSVSTSKATSKTQTTLISIGSTFVTRNTNWTDIPGEVFVNSSEYGSNPNFYFDASLKIGNGNGVAMIRLFDVTNSIVVSGSDLSVNSSNFSNVSSSNLPLWNGNNTYKIQIKSTSGEEASLASSRIRVVYK